jgi:hypothetical protein
MVGEAGEMGARGGAHLGAEKHEDHLWRRLGHSCCIDEPRCAGRSLCARPCKALDQATQDGGQVRIRLRPGRSGGAGVVPLLTQQERGAARSPGPAARAAVPQAPG